MCCQLPPARRRCFSASGSCGIRTSQPIGTPRATTTRLFARRWPICVRNWLGRGLSRPTRRRPMAFDRSSVAGRLSRRPTRGPWVRRRLRAQRARQVIPMARAKRRRAAAVAKTRDKRRETRPTDAASPGASRVPEDVAPSGPSPPNGRLGARRARGRGGGVSLAHPSRSVGLRLAGDRGSGCRVPDGRAARDWRHGRAVSMRRTLCKERGES